MMTLPSTRVPDPADAPAIRWGVLAPGRIARSWTAALHARTASRVTAVGSRSLERAQVFAAEFDIERAYGSYDALVADSEVDAIYVASPHCSRWQLTNRCWSKRRSPATPSRRRR
jgi:predicted dehydrogenase